MGRSVVVSFSVLSYPGDPERFALGYVVTQVTLSASLRLDSLRWLGSALAGP
jgi:hypothetical protein